MINVLKDHSFCTLQEVIDRVGVRVGQAKTEDMGLVGS